MSDHPESIVSHVLERVRFALDEARRTISIDHPVRLQVESAMADIDFFVAMNPGLATAGASVPPDGEDYEQPQRTLDIIARMLGWMNTPPRRIFEAEINALNARQQEFLGLREELNMLQDICFAHGWRPSEPLAGWLATKLGKADETKDWTSSKRNDA